VHPIIHTPLGSIPSYTLCTAAGFALAVAWVLVRHRDRGFGIETTLALMLVAAVSGLVGARAWFVLTHLDFFQPWVRAVARAGFSPAAAAIGAIVPPALLLLYTRPWLRSLRGAAVPVLASAAIVGALMAGRLAPAHSLAPDHDPFDPSGGGQAAFGGLVLATPAVLIAASRKGIPPGIALDCITPGVVAALAVGRLGCLLNGCCTGVAWSGPAALDGRFPSALAEFVALSVLTVYAALRPVRAPFGRSAAVSAVAYSLIRFVSEFARAETEPAFLGLTVNQAAAVLLAGAASGILLFRAHPQPEPA